MRFLAVSSLAIAAAFLAAPSAKADTPLQLTIKDHKFSPDHLVVPTGEKFILLVTNADPTGEEFESSQLRREKLVGPGATIKVHLGPLKPGTYKFVGDFHEDTAKGTLTAP